MGLIKKAKDAAASLGQTQAQQGWARQQGDGRVHVQNAGLIDSAVSGGPSTRSVAVDDPIWQPINGISLQDYAELARDAQARGVNDEAGLITLSQERGGTRPTRRRRTTAGCNGWASRWPSDSSSAGSSATDGQRRQPLRTVYAPLRIEISCSRVLAATRWEARKRWPSTERFDMASRSAISLFDSPRAASDMISR